MSTFASLFDTYSGFQVPSFQLFLNGTELPQKREQVRIKSLETTLSATEEAGALKLWAEVLKPDARETKSWLSALELGAGAELSIGYAEHHTKVFSGLLSTASYRYTESATSALEIEILCMDVKALMMASSHYAYSGRKKAGAVVNEILGRQQYGKLIGRKSVKEPPASWNLPLLLSQGSDYEVLNTLAEDLCYEFYLFGDTLYYGPPQSVNSPVVEFSGMEGILSLERSVELSGQVQKCTVTGFDDKGERITFSKSRPSESRTGSKKLSSILSGSVESSVESRVRSMEQAKYLAEARMRRTVSRYGTLLCTCCGLPEIQPGRFIKMSGIREQMNGNYYVREVTHILDENGFTTEFRAEG